MYGVDMYYAIKVLLEKGHSNEKIANSLKIHRNTVSNIKYLIKTGVPLNVSHNRKSHLDDYKDKIKEYLGDGLTGILIHRRLVEENGLKLGYGAVKKYLKKFKKSECYIHLFSSPGEEAQVDFGYVGFFEKDGKYKKIWIFVMTLSHSRRAYYELVLNQTTETFVNCHINAFEAFGGVPKTIMPQEIRTV